MTQKENIRLIEKCLPDIVETQDPEGVLLKCARDNNLSQAQLERVGQCFNTMITLTGLEKAAHRGSSFSILDVPTLVQKYLEYVPALHKKASCEPATIVQDSYEPAAVVRNELPDFIEQERMEPWKDYFDTTRQEAKSALHRINKEASEVRQEYSSIAIEARQLHTRTADEIVKISRDLYHNFGMGRSNAWAEIEEDTVDIMGKAASVPINYMRKYLADKSSKVEFASLEKKAFRVFSEDRHNAVARMEKLAELLGTVCEADALYKQALNEANPENDSPEEEPPKKAYNPVDDILAGKLRGTAATVNDTTHEQEETTQGNGKSNGKSNTGANTNTKGTARTALTLNDIDTIPQAFQYFREGLASTGSDLRTGYQSVGSLLPSTHPGAVLGLAGEVYDKIKPNSLAAQKYVDKAMQGYKAEGTLIQLMLKDPIISQYSGEEVQSIYNTIYALNPEFAQDPNLIGPVIKEALQYGSVPRQMVNQLSEIRKLHGDIHKTEQTNDALTYAR